jgi:hypothetical protein
VLSGAMLIGSSLVGVKGNGALCLLEQELGEGGGSAPDEEGEGDHRQHQLQQH